MSYLPATIHYVVPVTGDTITVKPGGVVNLLVNPAGTLATLTINLPASPNDGDRVNIGCSQVVTALTMGGGTLLAALTAFTANGFASYVFSATSSKWHRLG